MSSQPSPPSSSSSSSSSAAAAAAASRASLRRRRRAARPALRRGNIVSAAVFPRVLRGGTGPKLRPCPGKPRGWISKHTSRGPVLIGWSGACMVQKTRRVRMHQAARCRARWTVVWGVLPFARRPFPKRPPRPPSQATHCVCSAQQRATCLSFELRHIEKNHRTRPMRISSQPVSSLPKGNITANPPGPHKRSSFAPLALVTINAQSVPGCRRSVEVRVHNIQFIIARKMSPGAEPSNHMPP
ncbi:hypothetical protein BS50DRAFT_195280 [Corynespora cassiicola Philippines]|uniref:Uncharacterized protein n=1 Tax=Corynespora cassiicola Philippines TaxID=1448308 RepID=A0A2T2P7Y7_CORCC|nr:hypothetical protein BS50DRAFT_195280 [Corynespora cassiicola Philippines]